MEFRTFKYKPIRVGKHPDWADITHWHIYWQFRTGDVDNLFTLSTPAAVPSRTWSIIPTVVLEDLRSPLLGLSFRIRLRWLRWDIASLEFMRSIHADETEDGCACN